MHWRDREQQEKMMAGAACAVILLVISIWAITSTIARNNEQRGWIRDGLCTKVAEVLYTHQPTYSTHCSGGSDGTPQSCRTTTYQADPYMRSLWRCRVTTPGEGAEPDTTRVHEFWRRTAEEFE